MNAKIVEKAIAGDRDAFECLVKDTKDELFKFCIYLTHQKNLAEEICQATYLKALEHIGELKKTSSFKSWLFQIARFHFLNHTKSSKVKCRVEYTDKIEKKLKYFNHLEDSHIRAVINHLCPKERMTILLIDLLNLSYEEVGQLMGVSKASVRSRLYRARKEFIKLFRQYNWLDEDLSDEILLDSDSTKIIKLFKKKF